jgi:hypothetical protein
MKSQLHSPRASQGSFVLFTMYSTSDGDDQFESDTFCGSKRESKEEAVRVQCNVQVHTEHFPAFPKSWANKKEGHLDGFPQRRLLLGDPKHGLAQLNAV